MKNAYIYVDENNFPKDATSAINTSYNGSSIFIYPAQLQLKLVINEEKIVIDNKYKTTYNHVIALNTNRTHLVDTNTTPQNTKFQHNRSQYRAPPLQGNVNRQSLHNSFAQNQNQNTSRLQNNPHQNYENLHEKIKQLENQVQTLNTKITQLENNPAQYEKKFSTIETQVDDIATNVNTINEKQVNYDVILQKLTDNISKLSEAVYVRDKPTKISKRTAPYDKTSYEQTKKKHFTRSSSKPSSPKNSADD
ncbi:hypothetical protein RhiirA5_442518, partial [Rhizophagus irregularis]